MCHAEHFQKGDTLFTCKGKSHKLAQGSEDGKLVLIEEFIMDDKYYWSERVHPAWHPQKGFFKQSAQAIATGLKENSDSLRQAMDRLDFYINRAGDKLEDPEKFEEAKVLLHNLYKENG